MPVLRRGLWPALALGSLLAFSSAITPASAQAPGPTPAPSVATAARALWPQDRSDVKPDPALRYGVLPNGMRYVLMHNATPPGQISLRLRFNVGSLMETDKEQGLAHFIEHSTFDGSTHVKPHEIIKILERHGLAFGPDTNAFTNFDETVYQLDLPKADAETLNTGLFLMRETAGEVDFDKDAFENERGVVLGEERSRDGPGLHIARKAFAFRFDGQLVPRRFPIGDVDVIKTAPRERLVNFYHRYYRPSRATFVAVGDFDLDAMEAKVRERFADWKPVGPDGAEPDLGKLKTRAEETRLVVEPGAPSIVSISWVTPPDLADDSLANRRRDVIRSLGLKVLNRRLDRIASGANAPFLSAAGERSTEYKTADVVSFTGALNPAHYGEGVAAIETELKRAAEYGVTPAELEREITEMRAGLKSAADGQATRRSPGVADEIVQSLNDREVFTSPAQDLAQFDQVVKGLDAATVSAELKAEFQGSGPLVFAVSPTPVDGGEKKIAAAFDQARLAKVDPPAVELAKAWPYANFGPAGEVVEQRDLADLDATLVRFANGVRLTVKPTKFHKDEVLVSVRAGQGRLDLPRDHASQVWSLNQGLYVEGGLKELTKSEIDQTLNGKVLGASFAISDDSFVLSGATRPEDSTVEMQLLAAYLTKPGWRDDAWTRFQTYGLTLHQQLAAQPQGVFSRDSSALLRSGDKRWTFPSQDQIQAAQMADIRRLVSEGLAVGPVDVTIVGDISIDQAIAQTAATFGALPKREAAVPKSAEARLLRFPGPTADPVRLTHKGRADQAIGMVAWPTADFPSDPRRARQLRMLELVMQLRMTDVLRQKEGVTYSPQALISASWDFPGYGYVGALMEAPPEKMDAFFRDLSVIAKGLRDAPVTADELQRALKPEVDRLERERASNNAYWLEALSRIQADQRRIDAVRSAIAGLQSVTPAQILAAAQSYLRDETAYKLVIAPEKTVAATAAPSTTGR